MKILYYKGQRPNFGDDLNPWMWPKLLPGFFDDDDRTVFLGIGSIIGKNQPDQTPYRDGQQKIIFGSGFVPTYFTAPDVRGADWDVFFVRGPRTAAALGLPPEKSVGDSGILLRTLVDYKNRKGQKISFMPHWESMARGHWPAVCKMAGIHFIDPCGTVDDIIRDLLDTKVLITEAMHGAIIADAFRVPWVPVMPIDSLHRAKWLDWADALDLSLARHTLLPSSTREVKVFYQFRPKISRVTNHLDGKIASKIIDPALIYRAARRLGALAGHAPQLSLDTAINRATEQMMDHLALLKQRYGRIAA